MPVAFKTIELLVFCAPSNLSLLSTKIVIIFLSPKKLLPLDPWARTSDIGCTASILISVCRLQCSLISTIVILRCTSAECQGIADHRLYKIDEVSDMHKYCREKARWPQSNNDIACQTASIATHDVPDINLVGLTLERKVVWLVHCFMYDEMAAFFTNLSVSFYT